MRYLRTCAQLSVLGAVLPLAARAVSVANHCPVSKFQSFASIRFSNPLFQSPSKSKAAVAAEPETSAPIDTAALDASPSNVVAVYVTVANLEQGMLFVLPRAKFMASCAIANCCSL
jgi:hypothetical protein